MDITLAIIEIILALGFIAISGRIKKYPSNKWRLFYIFPVLLTIMIMSFISWDIRMIGLYIAPVIMALGLFSESLRVKRCIAGGAAAVALLTLVNISINPGYNRLDLYGDFEEVFASMKKHYILTEEKGIDWDKLYKEYKPKFKEADKKQDLTQNYQIWQQYAQEFYDGHVGYIPDKLDENQALSVMCESYGNDYGLSLIKLSTGEYAAVNVEGCGMSYSINDKDDINTNISRIFDNKIRTLNNSVIIRNPHHLYDQFEFTPELNISQRDNSATFSCESIIAEMNRSTPTSLSSIQIFDLKEENVEFNNNNIIVANEMPKNPDDEIQTIPFLDKQSKYIIYIIF